MRPSDRREGRLTSGSGTRPARTSRHVPLLIQRSSIKIANTCRADRRWCNAGLAPDPRTAPRADERGAGAGARSIRPTRGGAAQGGEDLPMRSVRDHRRGRVRFVSRGGLKLDGALGRDRHDAAGIVCLDGGQGTGGFTDALLQRGAIQGGRVDVGTAS